MCGEAMTARSAGGTTDISTRIDQLTPDQRALLRRKLWQRGVRALYPAETTAGLDAPASFTQRRIVFLQQLDPDSSAYHCSAHSTVLGPLNVRALADALGDVMNRHEVLRTTLPVHEGVTVQRVHPPGPVTLPVVDLSGLARPAQEAQVLALAKADQALPFRLATDQLIRFRLLYLTADESVLLLTLHHAIVDGWSFGVLHRELSECYIARCAGQRPDLPDPRLQYGDYARWQQDWAAGEDARQQISYWERQLSGAPQMLSLPTDRPRSASTGRHASEVTFVLPARIRNRVTELANACGATPFMGLLTAFHTVLARYSGQDDVVVGTPVANRRYAEFHDLIGFVANSVPLRALFKANRTFADQLVEIRDVCLAAYEHQDVSLDEIAQRLDPERALGRNPLYQVNFTLHNNPVPVEAVANLVFKPIEPGPSGARFDLDLNIWPAHDGFDCRLIYPTELFDHISVERIAQSFQILLTAALDAPDTALHALPLLNPVQQSDLLCGATNAGPRFLRCVHELITDQAAATPDAVAVSGTDGRQLSYSELDMLAGRFAAHLHAKGVRRGDLVAVQASRSVVLMVALLGVLKAGAAFVPLDPAHPARRVEHVLRDCGAGLLLTEPEFARRCAVPGLDVITLDDRWLAPDDGAGTGEADEVGTCSPEDLMYVIYTSGTTGKPKGVMLAHHQVANYLRWAAHAYRLADGQGVPVLTSLAVDLTITSLFAPLLVGQRVVLLDEPAAATGSVLRDCARNFSDLSMIKLTPSHLRILEAAQADGVRPDWTGTLVIGGEQLRYAQVAYWRQALPRAVLVNEYGPTETAVACVAHWDDGSRPASDRIPIGTPIDSTQVYVLDRWMAPVPPGVVGELYVGGAGVCQGYRHKPAETAESFIPDPFGTESGARLYRTGDLVRQLIDGSLEYVGRRDHQVKVRGYRIELDEIIAALNAIPLVRQSVVDVEKDAGGHDQLVAFVATDGIRTTADPAAGADDEQLARWHELYERLYQDLDGGTDPSFNLTGWVSSYTGRPIDAGEMRSWLTGTIERIRALRPRDVLEIGCGTGMIMSRIAPVCASYRATDLSAEAIGYLRRTLPTELAGTPRTELAVAAAHKSIPVGAIFDTVVLNSVVQYFPSAEYLTTVLAAAVSAVRPGGHVFIGDVRNLALLELFHASVQADCATARTPLRQLRHVIRDRVDCERELCLHPSLFTGLPDAVPAISEVRVLVKPGRYRNELNRYRYDVVLTVRGDAGVPGHPAAVLDWAEDGLSERELATLLRIRPATALVVRAVPNGRLGQEHALLSAIASGPPESTLNDVLAHLARSEPGVEPDAIVELAADAGYHAELSWAAGRQDGSFDLFMRPVGLIGPVAWPMPAEAAQTLANDPLWQAAAGRMLIEIKRHLVTVLPEAMVPARYRLLKEIPVDPAGKIDRDALRRHRAVDKLQSGTGSADHGRELTDTQQRIAAIWSELLGRDGIRASDDFFALGGHSLLAFQLVFRLCKEFDREVPMRVPFEAPTLAGLAAVVDELVNAAVADGTPLPALVPAPRRERIPLSSAQARLWFLQQLNPGAIDYNVSLGVRLLGVLDRAALCAALDAVVRRHEVLRTVLDADDEGRPYQTVLPATPVRLPVIDLSGLDHMGREAEATRLAQLECHQPCDLARPPVVRTYLIRLAGTEHILLLSVHHCAFDGWSSGVLVEDMGEYYEAARAGWPAAVAKLPIQYADYAVWQRALLDSGHYDRSHDYWVRQLAGVTDLPPLPAPLRGSGRVGRLGAAVYFAVPQEVVARLEMLSKAEDATLFMALLTAAYVTLWRYTGQIDLVIGSDVAGRSVTEVQRMIGFFVNQVVLRADLGGAPSWRELLHRVRTVTLAAYEHQDLPYEEVVKAVSPRRSGSASSLFGLKVVLNNTPQNGRTLPGLQLRTFDFGITTTRFDLTLLFELTQTGLRGTWEYDTGLFDQRTVRQLRDDCLTLLDSLANQPDMRITELPDPKDPIDEQKKTVTAKPTMRGMVGDSSWMRPTRITASADDAVTWLPLRAQGGPPMVIQPATSEIDIIEWAAAARGKMTAALLAHGALLLRGFRVTDPALLERFASVFVDDLYTDNGEHPRVAVNGKVYTPVFFPPEKKLLWHNENSFDARGPGKIWFCCVRPADGGGETPIADSREVYRRLDPQVRAEFIGKQIRYLRTYGGALGLDWREVFRTDDQDEVERRCAQQGMQFKWRGSLLHTAAVRPAAIRHPATGEWSWFNQAQHWHLACLDEQTRTALLATFGSEELPRNCTFGDGSTIPDSFMTEICRTYAAVETTFSWQAGDVLMVDNILVAHARNPFRGERKLLVAMGDMVSFQ